MKSLEEIRENQIKIDMTLGPVEEAYAILQKFQIEVPAEEQNRVDSLRYAVDRLLSQAATVQDELIEVQPTFKEELLNGNIIQAFNIISLGTIMTVICFPAETWFSYWRSMQSICFLQALANFIKM